MTVILIRVPTLLYLVIYSLGRWRSKREEYAGRDGRRSRRLREQEGGGGGRGGQRVCFLLQRGCGGIHDAATGERGKGTTAMIVHAVIITHSHKPSLLLAAKLKGLKGVRTPKNLKAD